MKLDLYQIDAFASKVFEGNPAAVIPLTEWLDDALLQNIAQENNLSETVYFVETVEGYHIRWFTPVSEVKLCGHATLASAYVLFELLGMKAEKIRFDSLSGPLIVTNKGDWFEMDFPSEPPQLCDMPLALKEGLGGEPILSLQNQDYIAVYESEEEIAELSPNFSRLQDLDLRGVIATAPSKNYDFVSRFFAPKFGVNEDPVTGSAHTQLIPYWAKRLNKDEMKAKQISKRGGEIRCALKGDRVQIAGKAVSYMKGTIYI